MGIIHGFTDGEKHDETEQKPSVPLPRVPEVTTDPPKQRTPSTPGKPPPKEDPPSPNAEKSKFVLPPGVKRPVIRDKNSLTLEQLMDSREGRERLKQAAGHIQKRMDSDPGQLDLRRHSSAPVGSSMPNLAENRVNSTDDPGY